MTKPSPNAANTEILDTFIDEIDIARGKVSRFRDKIRSMQLRKTGGPHLTEEATILLREIIASGIFSYRECAEIFGIHKTAVAQHAAKTKTATA